jgi:hypothetical protein
MKFPYRGLFILGCASILISAASAQTVLYGNLNATINGYTGVGPVFNSFSTGSAALNLTDVKVVMESNHSIGGTFSVGLYADNSTYPGNLISTLGSLNDSTLATVPGGTYDFTVNPGIALTANTRYWIGMVASGGGTISSSWATTNSSNGTGNIGNEYSCQLAENNRLTSVGPQPHGAAVSLQCTSNTVDPFIMQVTASAPAVATAQAPALSFTGITVLAILLAASAVIFLRRSNAIS